MVSRVMAGCVALAAFAIAIFAGLAAGNAAGLVLMRALMAMILCYPVGFIAGMICDRVVAMHRQTQREASEMLIADVAVTGDAQKSPSKEVTTV